MAHFAHLTDSRGYTIASEGNISRLLKKRFLITPTRKIKAFLRPKDLVVIATQGKKVNGKATLLRSVLHITPFTVK